MAGEMRLARFTVLLATRLPLQFAYSLAEAMATAAYLVSPSLRDNARSSVAYVLGLPRTSPEVSRAARRSMRNYGRDVVALCRYGGRPSELDARVSFHGLEKLDAALGEGKGVILVGLHIGCWDLGAAYLAHRRYPMNAVVLASKGNEGLDAFMHQLRSAVGIAIISSHGGVWDAAEALRRNEVLALLMDGPADGRSVDARFLEGDVRFSAGPAALALRSKAAVHPACTVRLPDGTFKGFIGDRVTASPAGNAHAGVQALTQKMLDSLEGFVRQYPDQWGMTGSLGAGTPQRRAE